MDKPSIIRVPVLIIGSGPAGLAAGLLLQKYGIETLTASRFRWTANTPRAHHINPRAMELLRSLGLEKEMFEQGMPKDLIQNINWCVSLAGDEIGRLQTYHHGGAGSYNEFTPTEAVNIPQHIMEPVMANALLSRGGDILFNTDCIAVEQNGDIVRATLKNRITDEVFQVEADYLIGADGANSLVAEEIGLKFDGQAAWGAAVNVWFRADLERYCAHRPGVLYWTNQPDSDFWVGSGVFIAVKPWTEWVVSFMYDPSEGEIDLAPEALKKRLHHIIGDDQVDIDFLSINKWQMNALYAQEYSNDRVFCMGDAVHRHCPANGLGANTSMLDAYNLAWKLKLVIQGTASPDLLSTYSTERQPTGRAIIERSMKSVQEFTTVATSIGFAEKQTTEERQEKLDLLSAPTTEGQETRRQLKNALKQQVYHFSAVGFELGYRYLEGALVPDEQEIPHNPDPDLIYIPQTTPGAIIPHVWVSKNNTLISTIDLVSGTDFHLITGPGGEAWDTVCANIQQETGLTITVTKIGLGQQYTDPYNQWADVRSVSDTGCILVRPDTHIAWRANQADDAALETLKSVVRHILGLEA